MPSHVVRYNSKTSPVFALHQTPLCLYHALLRWHLGECLEPTFVLTDFPDFLARFAVSGAVLAAPSRVVVALS